MAVLQSLADKEPDVDGMFRLIMGTPFDFDKSKIQNQIVALHQGQYTPYNGQATLHFEKAMFAMYLPFTVSGRVSDIWRAYISQALFQLLDLHIGFLPKPLVVQERNPHSNMADFQSEIQLYLETKALGTYLRDWVLKDKTEWSLEEAVEDLYVSLYEHGFLENKDVVAVQLFLEELSLIGSYYLPKLNKTVCSIQKMR